MEQGINNIKSLTGNLALDTIVSGLITLVVCYIAIRIVKAVVGKALGKATKIDDPVKNLITKAVTFVLWALTIIIVAGAFGINATSLVAVLSVAGLALSLSVQNILSNLFSGVTLLITKPFASGNFVEAAGKSGIVKTVGLFYTTMDTVDNVNISIPNSEITGSTIYNYSREPLRRVDMTFSTAYEAETEAVKAAIQEVVDQDSRILRDPAPFIRLSAYKSSCIDYVVRLWVKNGDYWDVYFDMNEHVRESFQRNGIAMTYEHLNVHIDQK